MVQSEEKIEVEFERLNSQFFKQRLIGKPFLN